MEQETQKIWSLYKITNLINGKVYIGQAADISKRWSDHHRAVRLNKPTQIIHHALIKYGLEHFVFEIIACCKTQEDANETETLLVSQYDSFIKNGNGYNATHGGMNAPKSDAFKQKMKEHWADPNYKIKVLEAISDAHINRTPEEKEATSKLLSEILKGRHLSLTTEFKSGHKPNIETIEKAASKIRDVSRPERQGVPLTQEVKNKISKSKQGAIPWNKNSKGIMKANSGSFKLGHKSPSKGKWRPPAHRKLTDENVLEIVYSMNNNLKTKEELSELFNVKERVIRDIMAGRTWNHITNL